MLAAVSTCAGAAEPLPAPQPDETAAAPAPIDEIVVRADPLRLIELDDSRTAYGLNLSYAQTPRAIGVVSDETISRFGIETVDDLTSVTPGAFTGSFFGVPGSVTLRGDRADTYFHGFKRVENPGSFPTPISASARIEIVRGPAPLLYGAGRVGGFLNITPETAKTREEVGAKGSLVELSFTGGSYGKKIGAADLGAAFAAAGGDGGVYLHAEHEDSRSFYRGISPRRTLLQTSAVWSKGAFDGEIGGAFFKADGYRQTIGINRVTQALIDTGDYVTGRDTDLRDLNGDGRLEPFEVDAAVGASFGASSIRQFVDFGVTTAPAFQFDTGVGRARLDPRTVFVSDQDVGRAKTGTAYSDFSWRLGPHSTFRFKAFYDSLNAALFQSYGFAANYRADVYELRALHEGQFSALGVDVASATGISYRNYKSRTLQTFLSGYLVVDRRDLTVGPQPNDSFDNPFLASPGGIGFDTDLSSLTSDLAAFTTLNARRGPFSVLVSGRVDRFSASAINVGRTVFDPRLAGTRLSDALLRGSVNVSATYEITDGARLYATWARDNALETNDGGGIEVDRIFQRNFVAKSNLAEAGAKLGTRAAAASLAIYRQTRTRQDPFGNVDAETSKGVEIEGKYLLTDRISLNGAATFQETLIAPPGPCGSGNGEFVVLPPSRLGIDGVDAYGGLLAALNASCLPELSDGYKRRTTPKISGSAYATYTAPPTRLGRWGATFGGYYVGATGGKIDGAIRLPRYMLAKGAIFVESGRLSLTVTADNLFNRRYFLPVQNVFEEVGALPGRGREIFATLKARF